MAPQRHLHGETLWRERLRRIDSKVDQIHIPDTDTSQDQEWCEVEYEGKRKKIRFHDYDCVYDIPGCYEELFYEHLKCCSPERVVGLLDEVMQDFDDPTEKLSVLDVGAGNGMVGDEFYNLGARKIVGIDIIPEAKTATDRDRPEVYDDYLVTDLTDLPEQHEELLRKHGFNCLSTVAALGFGDIPSKAFLKALDLISTPGWMAFNIKEEFLNDSDQGGFCKLIRQLSRENIIQIQAYRRYRHRLATCGKPLYYVAVVARKLKDLPDHMMGHED